MRCVEAAIVGISILSATTSGAAQCQTQLLQAWDAEAGDQFGDSISISGEWMVVGASRDDDLGTNSGAAYVFRRSGLAWLPHTKLRAFDGDGAPNDLAGWSVCVDAEAAGGAVIVVGAYLSDIAATNAGCAFVYRFDGRVWVPEQRLDADDAAANDEFGASVAVSNDLIVAGASREDDGGDAAGAAYVFRRTGGAWIQEAKLLAPTGAAQDRLGYSVAVNALDPSGPLVAAGAPLRDPSGVSNAGSVALFRHAASTWSFEEELVTPATASSGSRFGHAVALRGETLLIGEPLEDGGALNGGAAHFFARAADWELITTARAPVPEADAQFGASVGLSADALSALVARPLAGADVGRACRFVERSGQWVLAGQVTALGGSSDDQFGYAVALDAERLLVSAARDDLSASLLNAGSVVAFESGLASCADCDEDGTPDLIELSQNPALDCNGNGILDTCEIDENSSAPGGPFHCESGCAEDCNDNGVPDECDLASGTSTDANANAIPDECEDCNDNGIADEIDVLEGSSADCNTNGVPDECDVAAGNAMDCNGNLIPDECDIATGASVDCDGNSIPDECEDCNENGISDACDVDPGDPDGNGSVSPDLNGDGTPDECQDCNENLLPDYIELIFDPSLDCDGNDLIDACEIPFDSPAPGGPFYCVQDCTADCNGNGRPDACDLVDGTSVDQNANGLPDECEDCNGNGVADSVDIASATSLDCNGDGTPDECEIEVGSPAPGGPFFCDADCDPDCNGNGVPDSCDIGDNGSSNDCDGDWVPDECESDCNGNGVNDACDLAEGASVDLNHNGVPDECEPDCDEDHIPDWIEILFGVELDCNDNLIPDTCDLDWTDPDGDGLVSLDLNGSGIPDECESPLAPGDLNGDGIIGFQDLLIILEAFGACGSPPAPCPADLDGDHQVDFGDILVVLNTWS